MPAPRRGGSVVMRLLAKEHVAAIGLAPNPRACRRASSCRSPRGRAQEEHLAFAEFERHVVQCERGAS